MLFQIKSNLFPSETGEHKRENWPSPEADKQNEAFEILKNKKSNGFYACQFNSKTQEFNPILSDCKNLTELEIMEITYELNNITN